MGWADEARRRAARGQGGFRGGEAAIPLIGGPTTPPPRDRFGKVLKPGDLVLYHPPQDLVFQVMAIAHASVLGGPGDQVPPGDPLLMVLEIQVPLQCAADGRPLINVVTIGHMAIPSGTQPADQTDQPDPQTGAQTDPPMPTTDQGGMEGAVAHPEGSGAEPASTVRPPDEGSSTATPEEPST